MAALLLLIASGALGFGLGWLAKSAGRRVVVVELPDGTEERKPVTSADKQTARTK
jgi:hypothetical protein